MTTSVTEITTKMQRFISKHGESPGAIYVGQSEWLEINRMAEHFPHVIEYGNDFGKTQKVHGVKTYRVNADSHFGLKAKE